MSYRDHVDPDERLGDLEDGLITFLICIVIGGLIYVGGCLILLFNAQ